MLFFLCSTSECIAKVRAEIPHSDDTSNRAVKHALSNAIVSKLAKTQKHTMQVTGLFTLVDGARGCGVEFRR